MRGGSPEDRGDRCVTRGEGGRGRGGRSACGEGGRSRGDARYHHTRSVPCVVTGDDVPSSARRVSVLCESIAIVVGVIHA